LKIILGNIIEKTTKKIINDEEISKIIQNNSVSQLIFAILIKYFKFINLNNKIKNNIICDEFEKNIDDDIINKLIQYNENNSNINFKKIIDEKKRIDNLKKYNLFYTWEDFKLIALHYINNKNDLNITNLNTEKSCMFPTIICQSPNKINLISITDNNQISISDQSQNLTLKRKNNIINKDEPHTINKQIIKQNLWNKINFIKKNKNNNSETSFQEYKFYYNNQNTTEI
jgi:hypothetical protein